MTGSVVAPRLLSQHPFPPHSPKARDHHRGPPHRIFSSLQRASDMASSHGPLRVGIGGPVGSGKTALMDLLCKTMRDRYDIAAITNDIYTKWDAALLRGGAVPRRLPQT